MKSIAGLLIVYLLLQPCFCDAQLDSLHAALQNAKDGGTRYTAIRELYNYYEERNRDSALVYAEKAIAIARQHGKKLPEAFGLIHKAYQLSGLGRFAESLRCLLDAFGIANDPKVDSSEVWDFAMYPYHGNYKQLLQAYTHHIFGILMLRTENVPQQIYHFKEAARIGNQIHYTPRIMLAYMNLGQAYFAINQLDSSLHYERLAEKAALLTGDQPIFLKFMGVAKFIIGDVYYARGDKRTALHYYYDAAYFSKTQQNISSLSRSYLRLIKYHYNEGNSDSALYYALQNLAIVETLGQVSSGENNLGTAYEYLSKSYRLRGRNDSAFKYLSLAMHTKDSLNTVRIKNLSAYQNLGFDEQQRLQQFENERESYRNKVRTYALMAGLVAVLLIVVILYRNNRGKQKANQALASTLADLKATQSQLVQAEKMASLGELTAGIAHEIQNPLNFVNNFSEINNELLQEANEALLNGKIADAVPLLRDVIDNEQKITHHGKRAGDIVRSMLQHSRNGGGQKEITDINALCDEYLGLAYHALRARDKSFQARSETKLDASLPHVKVIPQELGRVLLNLFNNAFYAVNEKAKTAAAGYQATVSVRTRLQAGNLVIEVSDNGNGIPEAIVDKVFQPFFTTKPTGQGTGLGLSLSYDIITKAHGGQLKLETKQGEGTVFTIVLPL